MSAHIVLTAIVCLATCGPAKIRIWDGDTAWFGDTKIRMVGYDTPEFGERARCPAEARLAEAARRRLAELLAAAAEVQIIPTGGRSYDRTLARVLVDGRDLATILVNEGLASARTATRSTWC